MDSEATPSLWVSQGPESTATERHGAIVAMTLRSLVSTRPGRQTTLIAPQLAECTVERNIGAAP
jgi:hypothetical protein